MNTNIIGVFIAILSTFFYSLMDLVIKWTTLTYSINHSILYFQSTFVMVILLGFFGFLTMGKKLVTFNVPHKILIIRGVVSFCNFYIGFYVLGLLPLDILYSIIFFAPAIASIMAIFLLNEKLNFLKILSLALGLLGILIITNPFAESFDKAFIIPILLTLCLAFTLALAGVLTRKYLQNEHPISLSFYIFIVCAILGFVSSAYDNSFYTTIEINYDIIGYIVLIAILCITGIILFVKAYQITPIQLVAPTEYVLIVWGIFFGYVVFQHTPSVSTLLGAAIIIISNIVTSAGSKNTNNIKNNKIK